MTIDSKPSLPQPPTAENTRALSIRASVPTRLGEVARLSLTPETTTDKLLTYSNEAITRLANAAANRQTGQQGGQMVYDALHVFSGVVVAGAGRPEIVSRLGRGVGLNPTAETPVGNLAGMAKDAITRIAIVAKDQRSGQSAGQTVYDAYHALATICVAGAGRQELIDSLTDGTSVKLSPETTDARITDLINQASARIADITRTGKAGQQSGQEVYNALCVIAASTIASSQRATPEKSAP